ncbi:MAG TPA: tripartite tricarboxylate transporter substrate-binding protein [Burkholderiales bacterium]
MGLKGWGMIRARAIAIMSCLASTMASGIDYPSKPIRLVVPYAAGGSTDTVARIVGQQLSERVGQQVVIDNRTGAGTIIGTEIAAQAAPDGYTVLMATPPLAINPALYGKVPYDVERDFAAVTNIAGSSFW